MVSAMDTQPAPPGGQPAALVTGAARRLGAAIARRLHAAGYDLALHYRGSAGEAAALAAELEEWLGPCVGGVTRWSQVARLDLLAALAARLGALRRRLDTLAPTHFTVPSGSRIRIRYDLGEAPVLAVRIQEVFGLGATPRVAGGRVAVLLHLLSPSQRPVQVTADLESFWNTGYALVRKDLRGRYPRHYWPEDPREAVATRRVRPPCGQTKG